MVATVSVSVMSPAVRAAIRRYGTPALAKTSNARSRRPNQPLIQPWDGSRRNAASTCAGSNSWRTGWAGRPRSTSRTCPVRSGEATPAARWAASIAVSRRANVPAAAGQSPKNIHTVSAVAGNESWPVTEHQSVNNTHSAPPAAPAAGKRDLTSGPAGEFMVVNRQIICPTFARLFVLLGAHDEHLSGGVDDFGRDGLQLVDGHDAGDLGHQPFDQPEVAAGDGGDG